MKIEITVRELFDLFSEVQNHINTRIVAAMPSVIQKDNLEGQSFSVEVSDANNDGILPKKLAKQQIAEALHVPIWSFVDPNITELGMYSIDVQLAEGLIARSKLWVVPTISSTT